MKLLYSSWFGPSPDMVNLARSSMEMGEISNFLSQKHGFETIFVGDKKSIEMYKNVPFNKVMEFDDRINQVPKCMWSAGKLIALSMMDEPVIHVDFDMFFLNAPSRQKIEKDIVCFHTERIWDDKWSRLYDTYKEVAPAETLTIKPISYNCGIIGGNNINFIKSCINNLIEHIILNKAKIEIIYEKFKQNKNLEFFHIPAVLLEQIWLYQLFTYYNKKIDPFFEGEPCEPFKSNICELNIMAMNEGIIHFQFNKNNTKSTYAIKKMYQKLIK
jgi:hypothetical protein